MKTFSKLATTKNKLKFRILFGKNVHTNIHNSYDEYFFTVGSSILSDSPDLTVNEYAQAEVKESKKHLHAFHTLRSVLCDNSSYLNAYALVCDFSEVFQ